MRPHFTLLLLLLRSFSAQAQDEKNTIVDTASTWRVVVPQKNGKWHGLAKHYNKTTGALFADFTYSNGKMTGPAVYYDEETGCKHSYGDYKDSTRVGVWFYFTGCPKQLDGKVVYTISSDTGFTTGYFASGNVFREGNMKDNELDGVWKEYYDAPGKLAMISTKCFSKNNGDAVIYDSATQNIVQKGSYKCDVQVGKWETFDPVSKRLVMIEHFNDEGEYDGIITEYFPSGKMSAEVSYTDGIKNGPAKYYDPQTGKMIMSSTYVNDSVDGIKRWFYADGTLQKEGYYKMNIPYGFWKGYHEDGSIRFTGEHEGLTFISNVKFYAPNKKLTSEGKTFHDKRDGEWKSYDEETGELVKKETFTRGRLNGPASYYYKGGKTKATGGYVDHQLHGKWKRYYPSGRLWITMEYNEGEYTGELRSYYENGELKRKEKYNDGDLISSVCYTPDGKETAYTDAFVPPAFNGDMDAYFRDNIIYPADTTAVDGYVEILIFIDDTGKVRVGELLEGISPDHDQEAKRLIEKMGNWKPATLDGFPIGSNAKVLVPFKTNK